MKNKIITKNTLLASILLVLMAAVALFTIFAREDTSKFEDNNSEVTMCAMDVKLCSDGTYVGRTGENCVFVCPTARNNSNNSEKRKTFEVYMEKPSGSFYSTITPIEVVEDSRCPVDVQCIQAGTVRLRVIIDSPSGRSTNIIKLGESLTTESETITFTDVLPQKISTVDILSKDYTFRFVSLLR